MTRLRLFAILGGTVLCGVLAAASWGQTAGEAVDQTLQSGQPALARAPAAKLKPREDVGVAAEKAPTAASQAAAPAASEEDNPEMDSAAPPAKSAAAKPIVPLKRPRYAVAVLQALDKVTAETVRFEAPVNQPVRYKTLIFTVHACETTAPDEADSDAIAHLEIDSQPKGPAGAEPPPARQVFKGWMYASSPGLNLLEHPIYDAWLIACKTPTPAA